MPDFYSPLRRFVVTDETFRYDFIALNKEEALKYYKECARKVSPFVYVFVLDPIPNSEEITITRLI